VDQFVCAVLLHGGGVRAQTQGVVAVAAETAASLSMKCTAEARMRNSFPEFMQPVLCDRIESDSRSPCNVREDPAVNVCAAESLGGDSLAGQGAVQVGGNILRVHQAAGQVQRARWACSRIMTTWTSALRSMGAAVICGRDLPLLRIACH